MNLKSFLSRLKHRLWSESSILLLKRPAGTPLDENHCKPCPGEFRLACEENIGDCAAFEDATFFGPIYRKMLVQGDLVQFGYWHGKCVFRSCAQKSGPLIFDGCAIHHLAAEEATIHYVFCAPEARGNAFHTRGVFQLLQHLLNKDVYAMVFLYKRNSLKGFLCNGFFPEARVKVKNRFLFRTCTSVPLTEKEKLEILS